MQQNNHNKDKFKVTMFAEKFVSLAQPIENNVKLVNFEIHLLTSNDSLLMSTKTFIFCHFINSFM